MPRSSHHTSHQKGVSMRIGLVGVGRIGAFHAETLQGLDVVDDVVVADLYPEAAREVADRLGVGFAASPAELLASDVDGFVIATATPGHAPAAASRARGRRPDLLREAGRGDPRRDPRTSRSWSSGSDVPVHVGFQRRFDRGYQRARAGGRATASSASSTPSGRSTHDQAPPHAAYIPTSGGLFRDCSIHDFDIIRFVTGHEVVSVFATGANKGASFFTEAGDVDTAAAVLTLDDGTLVTLSATRYNGAGHDVRMEVLGSEGTIGVGYDQLAGGHLRRGGRRLPERPTTLVVHGAVPSRIPCRADRVRRGRPRRRPSPCTVNDALQAFRVAEACELSRHEGRVVHLDEIPARERHERREHRRRAPRPTTSSPSAAPVSTSTRSSTASASRTCGRSRSSSAAARPTWPWRPRATGTASAHHHPHRARPVRHATSSGSCGPRRRRRVRRAGRRAADAGDVLRDLPAGQLPALLLPLPDRARPAHRAGQPSAASDPGRQDLLVHGHRPVPGAQPRRALRAPGRRAAVARTPSSTSTGGRCSGPTPAEAARRSRRRSST